MPEEVNESKELDKEKKSKQADKKINLKKRVEVTLDKDYQGLKKGSKMLTHPENVSHLKKIGIIA